jgi:hypothetical protein
VIGVDGVCYEHGGTTTNQQRNNDTHGNTPAASRYYLTSFCFRSASRGQRNGFDAAAILWQLPAFHGQSSLAIPAASQPGTSGSAAYAKLIKWNSLDVLGPYPN